ncbi:MAG TPA: integrase core domain-containing protein [Candidatus Sulfotelmatobacter sp.]|nr:integrase core domain-containing protein [Candidatus Sulfotelmatobacter sp.]
MQVHDGELPRARQLARTGKELSREARVRLEWMDFYRRTQNVARTCRHFGISRQTFYRWQGRYDALNLSTLEARSHRPHRHRQPTWSTRLADRVLALRQRYPRWGKDKLAVLLHQQQMQVSTSMVGRILGQLKRHGRLREPPRSGVAGSRRALRPRPYAIRKPKQYAVSRPGDLVQVDTLEVRPLPGIIFKQFTARDVVSRWDVIQAHTRATASTAAQFLQTLLHRMPFPIRALQVDGGSEFAADFEQACQQRGLRLFVLPPRSPKLNGSVERAQRTHTEEFYQVNPCSLEMNRLNRELRQWEKIYNTVRPHQSLGYLTPQQFLLRASSQRKE